MIFHNIFKKTSEKEGRAPEKKPGVIADIHEKESLVIPTLHELGCEVETKPLKIGDYLIGNIVIERKTMADFIASMLNRRLLEQLRQLKQSKKALLIIENYESFKTNSRIANGNLNPNSIRGFILSILLNYQIPAVFTEDSEETAIYLAVLAKQQLKKPVELSLHARIPKTRREQQKYILEAFPNIGPKTAGRLLKKFRNLSKIFGSETNELEKILKSRAKDFKKLLD